TNGLVNRVGPTFVRDMMDKTGLAPADVARAYAITRDVFGLNTLWDVIDRLDNAVPAATQTALVLDTLRLTERSVAWFLVNGTHPLNVATEVAAYQQGVSALHSGLDRFLVGDEAASLAARVAEAVAHGVPEALAKQVAALPILGAAPDLVRIATRSGRDVAAVAAVYFGLGRRFGLEWLRDRAAGAKVDNDWQKQAVAAIVDDLFAHQSALTMRVLDSEAADSAAVDAWIARRRPLVERVETLLSELRGQPGVDLAMLAVANRQLRGLTVG
ncbi:NAD-glutamate dehydrogenase, partial [Azospirillum griseum]